MKTMRQNRFLALLAAALVAAACATPKSAQKSSTSTPAGAAAAGTNANGGVTPPPPEVTEASLRMSSSTAAFELRDDLKSVPFDYDSAKLSDDALAILKANADILRANDGLEVLVAGNCDERGTVAYNLALGQKRANQVRDYYVSIGIDRGRIATISYGKEQPLCTDSNEDCWMKNRRAESRARLKAGATPPSGAPAGTDSAPSVSVPAATPTVQ